MYDKLSLKKFFLNLIQFVAKGYFLNIPSVVIDFQRLYKKLLLVIIQKFVVC